jgi:hypothetical protein
LLGRLVLAETLVSLASQKTNVESGDLKRPEIDVVSKYDAGGLVGGTAKVDEPAAGT